MKTIPIVDLDMSLPPSERFEHIPHKLKQAGRTLARRTNDQIGNPYVQKLAQVVLDGTTASRNPYKPEIVAWAKLLGIPRQESLTANFCYELSEASHWGLDVYERVDPHLRNLRTQLGGVWRKINDQLATMRDGAFACTAGVAHFPKTGNVLVRTMDWCLEGLGRHTVIWHHTGCCAGDYYSIGWPGYVGVLSGNAPARFAATINQALPISAPTLQWPPSHLLRWVFDNCLDYEDAIDALENSPVCFPAFVTIAGTKRGEAAIVELTPKGNRVHHTTDGKPVAVANDYLSGDLREEFGLPAKTVKPHLKGQPGEHRRNTMLRELNRRKPQSLTAALKAIQADWIENDATVQQMAFCPASGECIVFGLEDAEPVAAGYVPPA